MKAIIHARIYDYHQFIDNGFVVYDKEIISVGPMSEFTQTNLETIDANFAFLMPSFVVGHTHIYSSFARGMSVEFHPNNFLELLEQLWWKLDRNLNNEMNYYSGIVASVDNMLHGVTTIIDHHASGVDIIGSLNTLKKAVCEEAGLRGVFAFETSDRFDVDTCIKENITFIEENKSQMVRGLFGLHASLSLSNATLKKVKEALNKQPIHIHVAESSLDQLDSLKRYKKRVIHRLQAAGLLKKHSILSHAIYVDESELAIIKKQGCVIAINATSNMNNGVGLPNILEMKRHGIPLIIGNDGISNSVASELLSIYYSTHLQTLSPTAFGFSDLIEMIVDTYTYTSELLQVKLGQIKPGFASDFLLIPYSPPTPITKDNVFGHLFFGLFSAFLPKDVWANGVQVVANYQVSEELRLKYNLAHEVARKLWDAIKKEETNES